MATTKKATRGRPRKTVTPDKTIASLDIGEHNISKLSYSSDEESDKDPNEVQIVGAKSAIPAAVTRPTTNTATPSVAIETPINNNIGVPPTPVAAPSMGPTTTMQPSTSTQASSKSSSIVVHQPVLRLQREQYMATRVRKEATDTIFRAVKFMNTENLVRNTLRQLSELMNVEEDLRYKWELVYRKDLVFAINNKRNSVAQDCKAKLKAMYMTGRLLCMTVVLTLLLLLQCCYRKSLH